MRNRRLLFAAAPLALLSALLLRPVAAQAPAGGTGTSTSTTAACGWDSSCPKTSPCCTEYGYCSAGVGCLGGCNPQGSYGEGYCAPMPVCVSSNYTFADDSRFQLNHTAFDGDATKYDWTLDKLDTSNNSIVQNNELVLTLTENGGGTRISSTRAVLYGTIQANIKTVGAAGVVTAFITMSGVKDEIDIEFTTNNTNQVQTNYFWEGDVDNYTHGGSYNSAKNRDTTYHTYGIQWTPDQLDFLVDGKSVRTLKKSDTKNDRYPQTPSRVQFSVWPAGIDGATDGTIKWAGGMIDWNSDEYVNNGNKYTAHVKWVSIDCYDGSDFSLPYQASNQTGSSNSTKSSREKRDDVGWPMLWERAGETVNSYVWGSNDTNGQIGTFGSNAATIINSPYSTGQNMLVKNGDTKGVTTSKNNNGGTGIFGDTVVGNWWAKQKTAVKAGIIIAACAVALFILVVLCTVWARSKDKRKQRAAKNNALKDTIPLVRAGGGAGGAGANTTDLPGKFRRQDSEYADSVASSTRKGGGGYGGGYGGGRSETPPVPALPAQYANYGGGQQPAGYKRGYSPYGAGPGVGAGSPYGGYPQQQQQAYPQQYGAYSQPQQYQQQWTGYGSQR
ncbi:hypothetical protein JCM8547_005520 [Rhodosporidiobolus lusitaniae]